MSAIAQDPGDAAAGREPILDTVERVSEMCFGLFMALTFVGAVRVITPDDPDPARTMFATALGCNLAWGLVDAIMYLVRTLTTRGKRLSLALALRESKDRATTIKALRGALPSWRVRLHHWGANMCWSCERRAAATATCSIRSKCK